jgi:hypothetical protein
MPSIRTTEMAGSLGETDGQVLSLPIADLFIGGGFVPHLSGSSPDSNSPPSLWEYDRLVFDHPHRSSWPYPTSRKSSANDGHNVPVPDKNAGPCRDCEANSIPCHR